MTYVNADMSKGRRPNYFWLLTETGRAMVELGAFYSYRRMKNNDHNGDGHPVMLLPGFMASETSLIPLENYLDELGYKVYQWGMGRNLAKKAFISALVSRLEQIYADHGSQVSLIGQSLGGIYARQIAKARPNLTRQIISLGSPIDGITKPNNARWLYDMLFKGRPSHAVDSDLVIDIPKPAPVPSTSVYSKEDGIVRWEVCLEKEDDTHQNIQVRGSHIGMAVNPGVLRIIEDRLLHTKDNWKPFKPQSAMEHLLLYPKE